MTGAALLGLVVVLVAGVAIGATGIGGVLLVPALTALGGLPVGAAIAASSAAFLFPGVQAFRRSRTHGSGSAGFLLIVSALVGALLGAALVPWLDPGWLRIAVALLAIGSGLSAMREPVRVVVPGDRSAPGTAADAPVPPAFIHAPAARAVLGALVGIGSALTGTGGPVLMLPLLLLLRVPLLESIMTAQAVQLPVALSATAVHAVGGRIDGGLVLLLGLLLLAGGWLGYRLAARTPVQRLRRWIAVALIATGLWYGWQSL